VKLLENERLYCYNPTYNEIENIESIIRSVLSQHKPFHISLLTIIRLIILQIKLEFKSEFEGRLF
jgi:dolichol-phosphate mannosyltransferase